jgi:hypothetical protein
MMNFPAGKQKINDSGSGSRRESEAIFKIKPTTA